MSYAYLCGSAAWDEIEKLGVIGKFTNGVKTLKNDFNINNKLHWDLAQDYYIWMKKITIYTFSVLILIVVY